MNTENYVAYSSNYMSLRLLINHLFIFIVFGAWVVNVSAEEVENTFTISEQEAVELALKRKAYQQALEAKLSVSQSKLDQANTLPNPVLNFAHERVDVPNGSGAESSMMISQRFDISGRRALGKAAAENRLQSTRYDNASSELKTIAMVRRAFANALHSQAEIQAHQEWLNRISDISETVRTLSIGGEASGYDRRRIEREVKIATTKLKANRADLDRLKSVLSGLIDKRVNPNDQLTGKLLPSSPSDISILKAAVSQHPVVENLKAQAQGFELDRQSAKLLKVPNFTLGLGAKKRQEGNFSDTGVMLSLSAPIPVFDAGPPKEKQAKAQYMLLEAEQLLKTSQIESELTGLWSQAVQLRDIALNFKQDTLFSSSELTQIAEASYRAGEGNLLEVLDAYRSELEAKTIILDLSLRARIASIELDTLTGVTKHD